MNHYRKVLCFNHSSLTINIPSKIVKEMNVSKGDYVAIDYKEGVMTVEKVDDKIKEIAEAQKK